MRLGERLNLDDLKIFEGRIAFKIIFKLDYRQSRNTFWPLPSRKDNGLISRLGEALALRGRIAFDSRNMLMSR